ncbi:MarR family winged helix-turn-helix transcriptional regulator [Sporohalobacter salinus]|uniref:MarR family winged helix-turn-helix transcriptional regulator n=1 Tax=Sporohalobacter salinus TaxID=1494606 RepID=UPI0019604F1E|nr:MarR family winged helix-turn-helix transcriptional regulator [Sporohalobacter salinus]MBM7624553.1 DNA-binding MarR family transcriptional regulator [Sporohalobacter salinus]
MPQKYIGKYLSIARRAHAARLDQKLKPYDISHGQVLLLIALYKQDGIYPKTLCDIYNINKAAVGRGLKKLKNINFITKETDPQDKRRRLIYLTDKAREFQPKLKRALNSIEAEMKTDLTKKEIKTFFKVIKKICNNLGAEINDN